MIFVTGDVHGSYDGGKLFGFESSDVGKQLTRSDYLIIAGDFGYIWDADSDKDLDWLATLPYTILFVDGNHENFDILNGYPVSQWNGGKVHIIRDNVIHLMRGQIFTIGGRTFFTFGGAESTDREGREEGVSWWPQEVPSEAEKREARKNLENAGYKVDYVITHTVNTGALTHRDSPMSNYRFDPTETTDFLEFVERMVDYKVWFFGHYHLDMPVAENKVALYNSFLRLKVPDGE